MDSSGKNFFFSPSLILQQQSDTLSVNDTIRSIPPITDTIKSIDTAATPDGINALFIEIERRSEEIRRAQEEQSRPRTHVAAKPKIEDDTTCYICPQGEKGALHQFFSKNQNLTPFASSQKLYDKSYYSQLITPKGPVFIETDNGIEKSFTPQLIIKPRTTKVLAPSWTIFPSIAILILLVYIKVFYAKNVSAFFRGGIFYFIAKRLSTEDSLPWVRLSFLLDVLYFISLPLGISLSMGYLNVIPYNFSSLEVFLYSILILIAFRLFRYITLHLIGLVSNRTKDMNHLYFNLLLYVRISSIILAPLVVLFAYSIQMLAQTLLLLSALSLFIMLIYRTFRTLQVFLNKGFSLFYLIMYLCTFEIIPVLLLAKVIY